jgi:RNA polymerase sigma-70 factor (ECF subfamily)
LGVQQVDTTSDQDLVAAIAEGDRAAFRELYERHSAWLTLRLARRCGDRDVVDQAVQDTFVAIWRKPQGYRGTGEVGAWIWGIGIRRLIDQLRRAPRRGAVEREELVVSAEERVLEGALHGDLGGALERLSPELRAVVQATVLDGLTTREAARLLGIPAGTVKTRMSRAKVQLREALA